MVIGTGASRASDVFQGRSLIRGAAALALIGWVGLGIGHGVARAETLHAYLTAFAFVTSIALGALILLLTTYVVGASWNAVIRRLNECLVCVLPVLALCFVPIALGLAYLYPWTADPATLRLSEHEQHVLHHKQAYLNAPFFMARAAGYFVIWSVVAAVLCHWSARQDRVPAVAEAAGHRPARAFSSGALPFVALALTFAAFDWLMSLDPFWMSSIFGVYVFAGGFVASLGLMAVLAQAAVRSGLELIRPAHFHALGRLMFGFTVFWAYIAFFQALLVALPNRPEEVVFYVRRLEGDWRGIAWGLGLLRFVVPFFLLLPRSIKFRGAALARVGALLVVGHYVDMYWLVIPVQPGHGVLPGAWDLAALAALVGTSGLAAAVWLRGKAVVPIHDPLLERSISYRSPI